MWDCIRCRTQLRGSSTSSESRVIPVWLQWEADLPGSNKGTAATRSPALPSCLGRWLEKSGFIITHRKSLYHNPNWKNTSSSVFLEFRQLCLCLVSGARTGLITASPQQEIVGFEKGRDGKTENLVVYQVVGSSCQSLPAEAWHWGLSLPQGSGNFPCSCEVGTFPKPPVLFTPEVMWMIRPGSFFIEGGVFLHKASQSLSWTQIKCPKKGVWMGPVCELDHLRREEHKSVAVAEPLTQPGAACIWGFWPYNGWDGGGRHRRWRTNTWLSIWQ